MSKISKVENTVIHKQTDVGPLWGWVGDIPPATLDERGNEKQDQDYWQSNKLKRFAYNIQQDEMLHVNFWQCALARSYLERIKAQEEHN